MLQALITGSVASLYILQSRSTGWSAEHTHENAYVEWVTRGNYNRVTDGRTLCLSEGNAYLNGPDVAHSDHYEEDYESLCFDYVRDDENDLLRRRGVQTLLLAPELSRLLARSHVAAEINAPDELSALWLDGLVSERSEERRVGKEW